ncbi:MAG: hypothetical protein NZL89_05095 [Leptospiraceae bacterium]|nr:hypothetical protein [Leptospiraceae bacterium]
MPEIGAVSSEVVPTLRRKQPVDGRGRPVPVRKNGYDSLDKNSFLKLLVTQLAKQDPTNPVNDREFIAQMAQFSALEQMNNVANAMHKLRSTQASELVGKWVKGRDFVHDTPVEGIATRITYDRSGEVFVSVAGRMVKLDDISEIAQPQAATDAAQAAKSYSENAQAHVSRETVGQRIAPVNTNPAIIDSQKHGIKNGEQKHTQKEE